ncbi:hypothetical protein GCM10010261_62400 [Streptomyces pilosus]|uniref:Uncharacterized protein n=1 Tax=Streptomyces pilosus TaxID=28893 RepID=A0A918C7W4_9ACTN|nr:hypothetical protein GCM10010280_64810 [Streptomyces pilosus]GGV68595.1 hypothetical protein GCM10010261_62400 [Streptomyces pilosus]
MMKSLVGAPTREAYPWVHGRCDDPAGADEEILGEELEVGPFSASEVGLFFSYLAESIQRKKRFRIHYITYCDQGHARKGVRDCPTCTFGDLGDLVSLATFRVVHVFLTDERWEWIRET